MLEIQNQKVVTQKQISDLKTKQPDFTLERVKEVFLTSNRATENFLNSKDEKMRNVLSSLLWNVLLKDKNIVQVSLKSPYDIISKAPKNCDILQMRRG